MTEVTDILQKFDSISLEEMDSVKLLNRTDTKYIFNTALLASVLEKCESDYRLLNIKTIRSATYKTLYFDNPDIDFYTDHHNERPSRYKVRIRNYVESGIYYLEIKHKKEGRTIKSRIRVRGFEDLQEEESKNFVRKIMGKDVELNPVLWNNFNRLTLVNRTEKERLTIDYQLGFDSNGKQITLPPLTIAELKQERINRSSRFMIVMKELGIRETGISKYCLGTLLTNPMAKYNNFKAKMITLNKIMQAA